MALKPAACAPNITGSCDSRMDSEAPTEKPCSTGTLSSEARASNCERAASASITPT